jgi:hypothetical protein
MGRTGRGFLAAIATAVLLAPSTETVVAAPAVADRRHEPPSTLAGSPTAFAERIAAAHPPAASAPDGESLQSVLELIALTVICAIAVAFYSSASTPGDDPSTSSRPRRR